MSRGHAQDGSGAAEPRRWRGRRLALFAGTLAIALAIAGVSAFASGDAPTVETEHLSALGRTTAIVDATVDPNGSNVSECVFEYGTSESTLENQAPCSYLPGELETPVAVSASLSGLAETTTYYFRIHAGGIGGTATGAVHHFTTMPDPPVSNTEPATSIGRSSATLNGLVNPDESEVGECIFEYGTTLEMTERVACSPAPGTGSQLVAVHATLSGLPEGTTYYYRVSARNAFGSTHGGRNTFETRPSAPDTSIEPAVSVTHTGAVLRGNVTPNGLEVETCRFEWGTSTPSEHSAPCEPAALGSGESRVAVTAALSGLSESTTYHFRLFASNAHGASSSGGFSFSTLPNVPKLLNGHARELSERTALLIARVDPQGEAITECVFEYGTTPALGSKVPCSSLPAAGEKYTPVSASLSGLSPATTYIYRLRAADASGVNYSREETFTTFVAGLKPVVRKVHPTKGSAAGGNAVTITGENLLGATSVSFGEAESNEITADSADSLTVTAPAGVGVVDVVVTTASGQSQIVPADRYTYGKPIIASIEPGHGPLAGGTPVTIVGDGFELGTSGTSFLFNKVPATSVECTSSTTCTAITPASSKAHTIKVQAVVAGKKSSASAGAVFSYE